MATSKVKTKGTYKVFWMELRDTSQGGGSRSDVVKFAWRAPASTYPAEIAKELGITEAKDTEQGLAFGMNSPRPVRIRINVKKGTSTGRGTAASKGKSNQTSAIVFCAPQNVGKILIKNVLRGKSYKGGKITSISTPLSSTNPHRKKTTTDKKTKTPAKKK